MASAIEPPAIYFNPWDEAYRANPYPYYEPLYGRPPHLMNLFIPMALVARYADAAAILHDYERFSSVPPRSPFLEMRLAVFGRASPAQLVKRVRGSYFRGPIPSPI